MVCLYQDPEGKMIFSQTDPSQSNMSPPMNQYTIDSLRKRIQELENEVSIIVDNVIFFRCQISWNFVCMNFPENICGKF